MRRGHIMSTSIVITGGGGMLAAAFKQTLSQRGVRAELISRKQWDITDSPQVERMFEDLHPTLCINCAAYTKVDQAESEQAQADAVNGRAVQTLAEVCNQYGTRLVHFSTDYVFDGSLRRPLRPDDPLGPQSAYGRSKLLGEQLLQSTALDRWLVIRTAWLYGPGGPCFPMTMINAARAGKPLKVIDDQIGSPTYTRDLADATLRLVDAGATGIFHVVNSGQTNWHDFTAAILEEFDLKAELSRTTSAQWKQLKPHSATRPAYSVLDTSKYTQTTGHTMRDWRDALRAYRHAVESVA